MMDAKTSVPEQPDAVELEVPKGEVAFEAVSFAYPGGPSILSDVSFVAQPGSVIALVGSTGAGKSTAMNLLQRLWDPTAGRVAIDGQDIRHVTLESLRRSIGVVFQESMLFNRSIRDNLRIGRPEATDDRGGAGLPPGGRARLHHAPAAGLRHDRRRARRHSVRRPAPAPGHRPRAAEEPAHPDPGRGHQRAGRRDGGPRLARDADPDGGPHDLHHRPPPVARCATPTRSWCSTTAKSWNAAGSTRWCNGAAASPNWSPPN